MKAPWKSIVSEVRFSRDTSKPLGVAEYRITAALPEKLKENLPGIEDLKAELSETFNRKKHNE